MPSKAFSNDVPNWFRMVCCATPLLSLVISTAGIAAGVSVSPVVIGGLSILSWRVISVVMGIKPSPLVIRLPLRADNTRKLE